MSSRPLPVLVLSAHAAGSETAASALAAGALDVLAKDDLDLSNPAGAVGTAFRQRIRMLSRTHVIRHPRARLGVGSRRGQESADRPEAAQPVRRAAVIGICASAGGPQVLTFLLSALPDGYPIPILIVQHLSPGFTDGLASWLDRSAALPVGVAVPGTRLRPGAWLAPEGTHLTLTVSGWLARDRRVAAATQYRPSGDVLLSSIALAAGPAGVAIVLSGMGSDGAAGAAARAAQRRARDRAGRAVVGGVRHAGGGDEPGRGRHGVAERDRRAPARAAPSAAAGGAVMTAVADIAELVRREAGIVLPVTRETAILAAVNRAAPGLGPDAFLRAASGPVRGRVLVERLIDEVTVQETAFVRDRAQFDAIPWSRLLHAAHAAGSEVIRVWSAGCATGEEAYTLALLAAEAFAPAPPPVDVLGTDIAGAAAGGGHDRPVPRAVGPRSGSRAARALPAPAGRRQLYGR